MPHRRSRRPWSGRRAPPRHRGRAPEACPQLRPPACSLPGEPYRAVVATRRRRFPRLPPGDPQIELLFDLFSRPRPRHDVKSDAEPATAVAIGSRKGRVGPRRGV